MCVSGVPSYDIKVWVVIGYENNVTALLRSALNFHFPLDTVNESRLDGP